MNKNILMALILLALGNATFPMVHFIAKGDNAQWIRYTEIKESRNRIVELEVWLSKATGKIQGMEKISFDPQKFHKSYGCTGMHTELSQESAQAEFTRLKKMFDEQEQKKLADQKAQQENKQDQKALSPK